MFKLSNYIKDAFIAQGESRVDANGIILINLKVDIDKEQISKDCEELVGILRNLHNLLESDYSFTVTKNKIILEIEN